MERKGMMLSAVNSKLQFDIKCQKSACYWAQLLVMLSCPACPAT
jgi:hypothetical protein